MLSRPGCVRGRGRCKGQASRRRCPLMRRRKAAAQQAHRRSARCAHCRCRRRVSFRRIDASGSVSDELVDLVGVMRKVQPGSGADLDNPPAGIAEEGASPAAHACDLTQPEKRVVQQGENPHPQSRRWGHLKLGANCVCHVANVRATALCAHRSNRPSLAYGPFRLPHRSPRRAASATAAVREERPSLRRMFATWR